MPVAAVAATFQRTKSCCGEALRLLRERARVAQDSRRGIRAYAAGEPAEQLPARLPRDLACEVPQREIERPAAAVVKIDVRQDAEVTLERERILTDEQALVAV